MMVEFLQSRRISLALRLIVGGVFLYAGAIKLIDPQAFADSIATFRLLPIEAVDLLALGLPPFEMVLGGLLLVGMWQRTAALGALGLCGVFALALTSALLRGLEIGCGCLGGHTAPSTPSGWFSLGRDVVLGVTALIVYQGAKWQGVACRQ